MGLGNGGGGPSAAARKSRNADLWTRDDKCARSSRRHDCPQLPKLPKLPPRPGTGEESQHGEVVGHEHSPARGRNRDRPANPDIRPDVTKGILELLHTKVAIATPESQDRLAGRLVTATWVLAGATMARVVSTIVSSWSPSPSSSRGQRRLPDLVNRPIVVPSASFHANRLSEPCRQRWTIQTTSISAGRSRGGVRTGPSTPMHLEAEYRR